MADKEKKETKKISTEITPVMMKERLKLAGITLTKEEFAAYVAEEDDLGAFRPDMEIPVGFKKCGKCLHVKKYAMFNKNSRNKINCTGTCKECQKASAAVSYKNTKKKRNYKKYYEKHKDMKIAHAKRYYEENKEVVMLKHKKYLATRKGKNVMKKAHAKRQALLAENSGIPYTRALVLDRDKGNKEHPICYLCGEPILDTSGASCHIDHVVSVCNGGLDCFTNVVSVHQVCNLRKTKRDNEVDPKFINNLVELSESYMDEHPDDFGIGLEVEEA